MMQICEAWASVMDWVMRSGASNINELPGLWRGETDEWSVAVNGHKEEVEGVPPYCVQVKNKVYLQVAVFSPTGGAIVGSESDLIAHFKSLSTEAIT